MGRYKTKLQAIQEANLRILGEQDNIQSASADANLNSKIILKDSNGKQIFVKNVQVKDNELIMDPILPIDDYYDGNSFTLTYYNQPFNGIIMNGDGVFEIDHQDYENAYNNKPFYSIRVSGLGPMT